MPYEIEWKEFTSGPPLLEALGAGSIHIGGVGNTPPLFAAAGKSEIKVVQGATYGGTGDAIVVPKGSDIKSVEDLKGKTVGVAEGSSANYNLLAQLEQGRPVATTTSRSRTSSPPTAWPRSRPATSTPGRSGSRSRRRPRSRRAPR